MSIASMYLTTLWSPSMFSGSRPIRKCVFQEGESRIVELSLFSMKLLAAVKMAIDRVK